MADDTIRIGAQFHSEEAQAGLRALGREFGLLPKHAGQGIKTVNRELTTLGESVKAFASGLRSAMPGLAGFGLGAAGLGFAVTEAARGLGRMAKSITDLKYLSKELGLTTQELQGLTTAAERVGMAPEEMTSALQTFKRNTEDFRLRLGTVREEMHKMGASDLLDRIVNSKTTLEGLKHAFDFSEAAEKAGRPEVGRRIMELLTGNAKMARNTWKEIRADIDATPIISDEELERGKRYNDLMISLGRSWEHLKQKFVLGLFDSSRWEEEKKRWTTPAVPGAEGSESFAPESGLSGLGIPTFQSGGVMPSTGLAMLHAGETVVPAGGDILDGASDTLTKTTKEGTFQGLMQFASYQGAGGAGGAGGAMQGLGGLPGLGGGGGGGGFGGGGGRGGGGGGGGSPSTGGSTSSGSSTSASLGDTGSSPGAGMSTSLANQGDRPGHYTGTVTLGGKEFQYGTGGAGRGSMPIGTHDINIGKGDIGPIGQRIGSIATVGKIGGNIYDPKIQSMRGGMQIHSGFSERLEYLKSQGCFAIKPSQWPAFKKALIEENKRTPGGLQLTIGKDGMAQITARGDAPAGSRQVAQGARPDLAPSPVSPPGTGRIDSANDSQAQPPGAKGAVDVKITSDGSAAKGGNGASPDLFQPTTVRNHEQMTRTEDAGITP